ncbi:hypothetical protein SASPL_147383 [Salvia splendens]|uniref:Uncharacterized protein n=1 Tax=Salvia splendens TaxID=180675 RepID=A0A8X8Z6G1_SALSN|nr:hypothetical protein SASPL_147383 [Salvia splendens]
MDNPYEGLKPHKVVVQERLLCALASSAETLRVMILRFSRSVIMGFDFVAERIVYDCRSRKFIARLELPATSAIVEYEGSFISP